MPFAARSRPDVHNSYRSVLVPFRRREGAAPAGVVAMERITMRTISTQLVFGLGCAPFLQSFPGGENVGQDPVLLGLLCLAMAF